MKKICIFGDYTAFFNGTIVPKPKESALLITIHYVVDYRNRKTTTVHAIESVPASRYKTGLAFDTLLVTANSESETIRIAYELCKKNNASLITIPVENIFNSAGVTSMKLFEYIKKYISMEPQLD